MIDGSVLQSAQRCFEKKSRVVVKMVVRNSLILPQLQWGASFRRENQLNEIVWRKLIRFNSSPIF